MKANDSKVVTINPLNIQIVKLRIVGDSPLLVHKWSEKSKKEMLDTMMNKGVKVKGKARPAKDPVAEFIDSIYWICGAPTEKTMEGFEEAVANGAKFGFPVTAIKQAVTSGAYRAGWIKDKVSLKGAFFIESDAPDMLAEIKGSTPVMSEEPVRVGNGAADLRYRGLFKNWYMDLRIRYNASGLYTLENIVNAFNYGGFSCGIGEWRTEKNGQYGSFHVQPDAHGM